MGTGGKKPKKTAAKLAAKMGTVPALFEAMAKSDRWVKQHELTASSLHKLSATSLDWSEPFIFSFNSADGGGLVKELDEDAVEMVANFTRDFGSSFSQSMDAEGASDETLYCCPTQFSNELAATFKHFTSFVEPDATESRQDADLSKHPCFCGQSPVQQFLKAMACANKTDGLRVGHEELGLASFRIPLQGCPG